MRVVYAPRALRDLEGIAAYLAERSPKGASSVLAAIKSSIDTLSFFPEIGRLVDDAGHRHMPVLRYPDAIFYRMQAMNSWYCMSVTPLAVQSIRQPTFDPKIAGQTNRTTLISDRRSGRSPPGALQ